MKALLQRVTHASVVVENQQIGEINKGVLAFIAIEPEDSLTDGKKLIERVINYRIFSDSNGKMNLSLKDIPDSGLLLVSQFTLAANTQKGLRPSFISAAAPDKAKKLFEQLIEHAKHCHHTISSGQFAADMQVSLTNDGPVTFMLTT